MINYFKTTVIIFLTSVTLAQADPKIKARTAILVDYHSDEILYELQPDHSIHPASMTKKSLYQKKHGECPRQVTHPCL